MQMQQWETMHATLQLDDGTTYHGTAFGAPRCAAGEVVFQTGMVGYVEALTDPSYAGQLLALTFPLIGNYGVPDRSVVDELGLQAHFESGRVWPTALIIDRLCPDGEQSHWQANSSLDAWLREQGVPGLAGIDVRALTKHIREHGTMKAKLILEGSTADDCPEDISDSNLVQLVTTKTPKVYNAGAGRPKVLAVDCGMKNNQIRCLARRGFEVHVVPADFPFDEEQNVDGLFISNGPGDPAQVADVVRRLAAVVARARTPIFGICLGHQLLARAVGAKTYKLTYGNRGHNQPCTHATTNRCLITSQNHGFAVDEKTLPPGWKPLFTNENDRTNEGIVHETLPFFSVQFHPEHTAGPTDSEFLFDVFAELVKGKGEAKKSADEIITKHLKFDSNYEVQQPQRKVLVLGSGGLTIGQAGEFDYSGAQALKALREEGIRTILINPNVATVQTSKGFADQTYFLPITKEYVADVIRKERPTGILCTFGGQTALNCAVDLYKDGVFEQFGVQVLGTPIDTIMKTEDREAFAAEMAACGERVAPSYAATNIKDTVEAAEQLGYPVLVRAAFALGGLGSGFAEDREQLEQIAQQAFAHSNQVLVDKSLKGWKEVEYEVVRDAYNNCVTVCNMENVDPLGIHTGESVVVAPSQTLSDAEYNMLRTAAVNVIRHLGIIGECNIQYALNPYSKEYYVIEVNARLSRSSALASKATGYPLAYVAAKLALGQHLPQIKNSATACTTACFEPSLDYCVVKIPRWDLSKFVRVATEIGSSMKSVGEVMGIGRSFEEAFQKALRMVNEASDGFAPNVLRREPTDTDFSRPTDKRMWALAAGLHSGKYDVERLHELTKIDKWFLHRMAAIADIYHRLEKEGVEGVQEQLLREAKQAGFADRQIATALSTTEIWVRETRQKFGLHPVVKQIDTVAGEWPAATNYLYLTYNGREHDVENDLTKPAVLVLGSGVYRIGSSVEFDASCVGCLRELRSLGYATITLNCNPETVSTDYDMSDRLYFEDISFETVVDIYARERPRGVILAFGGQAPNNIAMSLVRAQLDFPITVLGTSPVDIDQAEDRFKFSRLLESLQISQPRWKKAETIESAKTFCAEVGYPCLIRPSYVLSGAAMNVAHSEVDLATFLAEAAVVAKEHPVVVSKFIRAAKEIDVDAVALAGKVLAIAISEHIENAGIHSGDATLVTPPQDINELTMKRIKEIAYKIAAALNVTGPFNMQLIAKNDELKVIECNLRVSRSFPFVSKTLDFDFVALATRAMIVADKPTLKSQCRTVDVTSGRAGRVGVKVPQFSFSRLAGADVMLGVEMASTGEVGCLGKTREEAYLKALLSTGFVPPQKAIFLSIGGYHAKDEMLPSVQQLAALKFELFASKGTADFCRANEIPVTEVDWPFEEGADSQQSSALTVADYVKDRKFDLLINLPITGAGSYRVSAFRTHGYRTRRMAIDNGIPLLTDIKAAKLFIRALVELGPRPPISSLVDCITSRQIVRLPGLIDCHVHVREPGQEHKETWKTATRAALAGGVTTILAMPNTVPSPLIGAEAFALTEAKANESAHVDYALFLGATDENVQEAAELAPFSAGLKMYLGCTFGTLRLDDDDLEVWSRHLKAFPRNRMVVAHAEGRSLAALLCAAQLAGNRPVHIAHVATKRDIETIREAKTKGWLVSCEVAPHHLFLTQDEALKKLPSDRYAEVRPRLGTEADRAALWANLDWIDCFATDHAPHLRAEKESAVTPGFPGVEYMLPLLLTAVAEGKLTRQQLVDRLHRNPARIFNLPPQPDTYVEVDMSEEWTIPEKGGESLAGWTPYAGRRVKGRVQRVVLRGEEAFVDGAILVPAGYGRNLRTDPAVALTREATDSQTPSEGRVTRSGSGSSSLNGMVTSQETSVKIASRAELAALPLGSVSTLDEQLKGFRLVSVTQLNKAQLHRILDLAGRFQADVERGHDTTKLLRGCVLASLFYEVSTRTSCSFAAAMQRLGGTVVGMDAQTSSVQKGETLEDSVQIMSSYADVTVLRHPEKGAAARAARVVRTPFVNAGDGTGEHPSQALLDLYTIRSEISTVNGITIALVGDLKNGRTVHSLARLLCLQRDITLHYVAPIEELQMPQEVEDYVKEHGDGFTQKRFSSLAEGIRGADVVYVTRVQKERFATPDDYNTVKGKFILTSKLLNEAHAPTDEDAPNLLHRARKLPIVMHPLPRVDEIAPEVDADERAAYFRQAQNGLFVRMALLALLTGRVPY